MHKTIIISLSATSLTFAFIAFTLGMRSSATSLFNAQDLFGKEHLNNIFYN